MYSNPKSPFCLCSLFLKGSASAETKGSKVCVGLSILICCLPKSPVRLSRHFFCSPWGGDLGKFYCTFFNNFLTKFSLKFFASNSESHTTILWGPYKSPPTPPSGGTDFWRCLVTTLLTTLQKTCRKYNNLFAMS